MHRTATFDHALIRRTEQETPRPARPRLKKTPAAPPLPHESGFFPTGVQPNVGHAQPKGERPNPNEVARSNTS